MNARDDLAREIFIADNSNQSREASIKDWETYTPGEFNYTHGIADGLLAAGYRKARTIGTVEELNALPHKSVLLDSDSEAVQRIDDETMDGRSLWETSLGLVTNSLVMLPATVLYEPTPDGAE